MGRAISMESDIERLQSNVIILDSRLKLMEEALEELIKNLNPVIEKKTNEKKAKKSNKK